MPAKQGNKDAAEALRQNIRALMVAKGATQRAIGHACGMKSPDQTVSDFLRGKQQSIDFEYLGPMARFFGVQVAELFSVPVTTLDTASTGESRSQDNTGDRTDGTSVDLLRRRLAAAQAENAELRHHVEKLAEQIVAVARGTTPAATTRTTPRRRDR